MTDMARKPVGESSVLFGLRRHVGGLDPEDLRTHAGVLECAVEIGADDAVGVNTIGVAVFELGEGRQRLLGGSPAHMDFVSGQTSASQRGAMSNDGGFFSVQYGPTR